MIWHAEFREHFVSARTHSNSRYTFRDRKESVLIDIASKTKVAKTRQEKSRNKSSGHAFPNQLIEVRHDSFDDILLPRRTTTLRSFKTFSWKSHPCRVSFDPCTALVDSRETRTVRRRKSITEKLSSVLRRFDRSHMRHLFSIFAVKSKHSEKVKMRYIFDRVVNRCPQLSSQNMYMNWKIHLPLHRYRN